MQNHALGGYPEFVALEEIVFQVLFTPPLAPEGACMSSHAEIGESTKHAMVFDGALIRNRKNVDPQTRSAGGQEHKGCEEGGTVAKDARSVLSSNVLFGGAVHAVSGVVEDDNPVVEPVREIARHARPKCDFSHADAQIVGVKT